MKKRIILAITVCAVFMCLLATVVCAENIKKFETDELQAGENVTYLEGVNTDAYLDDSGRNQDITTLIDNEKYFSRVVLKNSDDTYTTYPAWYVLNLKYDWQGSYQYSTVERLNALSDVTGETYEIEDIIRFEYPEFTAEAIKSKHARSGTGTPGSFPNAKYIRIPTHFTGLSFFNGYEVEIIDIPSECKIVTVGKAAVLNCYKLKELILPNSVTTISAEGINFYTQQSTSQLKLLNLGAGLTKLGGKNAIRNCAIPGIRVICPATLDGATYNYEYFPKTAVVIFTGNKAQAEAFGFSTVISYDEYVALGEEAEAGTIVYGYSECEAFYNGNHNYESVDGNTCSLICSTCGDISVIEAPIHKNAWVLNDGEAVDFLKEIKAESICTECGTVDETITINRLFVNKGYTKDEVSEVGSISYGFLVDNEAVMLYEEITGEKVSYGIIVAPGDENQTGDIVDKNAQPLIEKAITTDFTSLGYKGYNSYIVKLNSIEAEAQKQICIYCNAYIIIEDDIYYMGKELTAKAVSIKYSEI